MEQKPRKLRGPFVVLVGVPVLLAIYVLSLGPTARLACRAQQTMLPRIYSPLMAAGQLSPTVGRVVVWYVNKWLPESAFFTNDGLVLKLAPSAALSSCSLRSG